MAAGGTGTSANKASSSKLKNAMLILPPILAAYLGVWQVGRREEKIRMLEERERVMSAEDDVSSEAFLSVLSDIASSREHAPLPEYTKVSVSGRFDEEKSVFIGPRPRSSMGVTEAGYFMVTPMYVNGDPQAPLIVLRGWVPESWKKERDAIYFNSVGSPSDVARGVGDASKADVAIRGVVRYSEKPSMFVPENCPRQRNWYYVDVPALARALELPESTLLVEVVTMGDELMQYGGKAKASAMDILAGRTTVRQINQEREEEMYPIAKSIGDLQHFSVMPRDHLNYAVTWFSLSAATSGLAFSILRRGAK
jgi:surfeit locus 1 family protein